ncbi:hypothetical protein Tco_0368602 [Tanacetum coccineum]
MLSRLLPTYYCLSPTTATLSPLYHEPLIASVAKVNVVNRSIGTDNPRPDCTNQRTTNITVNGKAAYELKGRFLDDLCENAFSGTNGENTVEHIEYFLKVVDLVELTNVNHERLRLAIFPISLPSRSCKVIGTDADMEYDPSDEEVAEIFRIETNIFDFETPLCKSFDEFSYLLKVNTELFTHDIERTKTYEDYMNELNNELDEPWSENGVPYEICDHICELFRFKNGDAKWPTCNSNEDGFCNGGELPGMVRVGYRTYFQDYEFYDNLTDNSLKEETLKQKTIYEKSWGDATQSVIIFCAWLKKSFRNFHELDYELLVKLQECWWKIKDHECSLFTNWRDHIHEPYTNINTTYDPYLDSRNGRACNESNVQEDEEQHEVGRCDLFNDPAQEPPVCKIRIFEMIKYSSGQEEEYVAVKEYEYDDLTNKDVCQAYQQIFRNMDEGWLVTRAE